MTNFYCFFVCLFLSLGFAFRAVAQPLQLQFERIGVKEGLSVPTIRKVAQDSKGFLWIATADGLNRYDGLRNKVYRNFAKDSTSLSNNYVRTVLVDSKDRIWVGTWWGGLCLYQPEYDNFKCFAYNEKDSTSISHNNINTIFEDTEGNIWVGTWAGLNRFEPKTNTFQRFLHNDKNPLSLGTHSVNVLCEDKFDKQILWIGTYLGGVNKLDKRTGHFQHFRHQLTNEQSVAHDDIRDACVDKKGSIWFATPQGITLYEPKTQKFRRIQHENYKHKGLITNDILSLLCDKKGRIWIGTGQGLYYYDEKQDYFYLYGNEAENPFSLSENSILCLYQDLANRIWVGTWGGLNKYDPLLNQILTYKHKANDENSLSNNVIWSINTDAKNNVWIGTQQGVNCWKPAENKFYRYTSKAVGKFYIPYDNVGEARIDTKGLLWIGTWGGGLVQLDTTTGKYKHLQTDNKLHLISPIKSDNLHNIFEDSKGNIWIGTFGAGLYRYNQKSADFQQFNHDINDKESLVDVNIRMIAEDKQGNIWIGTNQGLGLFEESKNKFRNFKNEPKNANSLAHNTINALHADSKGKLLWVGTMASLDRYEMASNTWKSYVYAPELGTVSISSILEDKKGLLWLATSKGICSFSPVTETFKTYVSEEMLNGNELHLKASEQTQEGNVIFGGTNGFVYFHPDSLKTNTLAVKTVLTNLRINNEIVPIGKYDFLPKHISLLTELNLEHENSSFTIEFASIHHTLPKKNQVKYFLEGLDTKWQNIGNQNFLSFHYLPYGNYVLHIKSLNSDGVEEIEGIKLKIIVYPPWWQTWWAKTLAFLLVVAILYGLYKNRIRQIKNQKDKLEQVVQLRTQEILMQKEEINAIAENLKVANEEISGKTAAIQQAYNLIEEQNKAITDSMRYASRIQQAMLPFEERMNETLGASQHFILYKPRDIVSGDFYWLENTAEKIVLVVADCTGHGIPGAFMSFIGISYLENIVIAKKILEPNKILQELHIGIIHALKQSSTDNRDGMDTAVVVLDKKEQGFSALSYSGAMNPIYLIKKEGQETILLEIKADKMPIGGETLQRREYQTQVFDIEQEQITHLYLFSDGFQDQFGGKQNKKFKAKAFKDLIISNITSTMQTQKEVLNSAISTWIEEGKETQTDDITVVGLKLQKE